MLNILYREFYVSGERSSMYMVNMRLGLKIGGFLMFFCILLGYISVLSGYTDIFIYENSKINRNKTISTVEFDIESIKNSKSEEGIKNPSYEELMKLAETSEVKSYEINFIDILLSTSLRDIDKDSRVGLFNVKGVDKTVFYDLSFGNIYLERGRTFSTEELRNADYKLMVSDIVAKNNNLEVGDTVSLEMCNPSNVEQHITREFILIGIFNTSIRNNQQNSNKIKKVINEFLEHEHIHGEDNKNAKEDMELYKNDSDRMESLKNHLLIEDLNTVYMPNSTAKNLNIEIGRRYGAVYLSNDYQATYVLQLESDIKTFKRFAKKILSKNFVINCGTDAYELWMPNTYKAGKILGIYSVLMGGILFLYTILIINRCILNNKRAILQYRCIGFGRGKIEKYISRKYWMVFTIISCMFMPIGNFIAVKYILAELLNTHMSAEYYNNIQKMTRNIGTCFTPKLHVLPNVTFVIILCITLLLVYLVIRKTVRVSLNQIMEGRDNV